MTDMWTNIERIIKRNIGLVAANPIKRWEPEDTAKSLLIVFAVTILSFLLVDIFYKAVSLQIAFRQVDGKTQSAAALPANLGHRIEYYNVIAERNLFKTTLQATVNQNMWGNLPPGEEHTAFELKGTMAINRSMGYAIVEEKGKDKQKLYRLGEMIGSARLIGITRNTAVLKGGGKEFVMKIREIAEAPLSGQPSRPGRDVAISKQEITQGLGDLTSMMSQAVIRPFMVGGIQNGFVVSNIVPGSLYQKLGLQNGDIVVNVNHKKLESAEDILHLVNIMQGGGSVSVNLVRNGKNENISYSFN
jgi:general secretion pathway protein C